MPAYSARSASSFGSHVRRSPAGEWDSVLDPQNRIGYLRVPQFTDQTAEHMAEVLTGFQKAGIRSIIVDLRFNPGGLLRAATKVADEFLDSGRIVSTALPVSFRTSHPCATDCIQVPVVETICPVNQRR